jgi:hypothetical protein
MTLTTSLAPYIFGSGWAVTFSSTWESGRASHSWLFHVSDDRKVDFIREEGDELPDMPQ